jgi:hypothetical protein
MKHIALELLDGMLNEAYHKYFYDQNNEAMEEIRNLVRFSQTLSDAGMSELDIFHALLKRIDITNPANHESEVRLNAYGIVNKEFLNYKRLNPSEALVTPSTFNMALEVEKAQKLTTELKAVTDGIALALAETAEKVTLSNTHNNESWEYWTARKAERDSWTDEQRRAVEAAEFGC